MKVLIACEFSGTVRDAFAKLGHDAWSCDLLPTEKPGQHIIDDARNVIRREGWDIIIAHPPCTYLCNSGVCHLDIKDGEPTNYDRKIKMQDAAMFFNDCFLGGFPTVKKKPRICCENPIMHKYARALLCTKAKPQIIQPWMFGHMESKATCLWLDGLPPLIPTKLVRNEMFLLPKNQRQRGHYLSPSPDRWKLRSTTYQGIADAMATQWGIL